MAMNTKFESYKVAREIKKSGKVYDFERRGMNQFKEPTGVEITFSVSGIYHEQSAYVTLTTGEAAISQTKKVPMILCLYDGESEMPKVGDEVKVNKKKHKVTGVINVQEWNEILDISLEPLEVV